MDAFPLCELTLILYLWAGQELTMDHLALRWQFDTHTFIYRLPGLSLMMREVRMDWSTARGDRWECRWRSGRAAAGNLCSIRSFYTWLHLCSRACRFMLQDRAIVYWQTLFIPHCVNENKIKYNQLKFFFNGATIVIHVDVAPDSSVCTP